MTDFDYRRHVSSFISKMAQHRLPQIVTDTFVHYYSQMVQGETGLIPDSEISPVTPDDVEAYSNIRDYANAGRNAMKQTVLITLNGGLGTSMGLTGPKSLIDVKDGKTFLEIILNRAEKSNVPLILMNSFSTDESTRAELKRLNLVRPPRIFLQHKFPKILKDSLEPATWERNPELEWNPPGHGDIYVALKTSGMIDALLDQGIRYAFICNSDNLGATLDEGILGYFSEKHLPFMMEVCERTPSDIKGGHLARCKRDGRLILREAAQCPVHELDAFQDICRYRFFNTNNLWVNLEYLERVFETHSVKDLPLILNPKTLDPRDDSSPSVIQIETAMGTAISLFDDAGAINVPRTRFFPVKKCNDLMIIRSDCFLIDAEGRIGIHPKRKSDLPKITLDPAYYGKIDRFAPRFPKGIPSLLECESLSVHGDVLFESDIVIKGNAIIKNLRKTQVTIPAGSVIENEWTAS